MIYYLLNFGHTLSNFCLLNKEIIVYNSLNCIIGILFIFIILLVGSMLFINRQ